VENGTIDYFMSPSSPWTYLGSKLFTKLAGENKRLVNVYPVNFGKIFPISGGLPLPKRAPQRQAYRLLELHRWKSRRKSTMKVEPNNFPSTAALPSLAIIAARELGHDALKFSNSILAALWEEDLNIDDPDIIGLLCERSNLNQQAILEYAYSNEAEEKYESYTNFAIKKGVFGAPSYIVDGELFWGQDRLDFVSEKLK
tara:strand:- start:954 stop:1550 length:597 start_codon:yes stop_codon:yes gene_type:complete